MKNLENKDKHAQTKAYEHEIDLFLSWERGNPDFPPLNMKI